MDSAKNSFKGLLLNFYKRQVIQEESDLDLYDIVLFGHYDGLSIRQTHSWYEFSPHQINKFHIEHMSTEAYVGSGEYHPVKLVYPEHRIVDKWSGTGFWDYECWSHPSLALSEKYPCPLFSILLLNFSGSYISKTNQNGGLQIQRLIKCIDSVSKNVIKEPSDNFRMAVFQSIGYYDCAILFRADKWDYAFEIANYLQSIKYENVNIVSNTYFISGIISLRGDKSGITPEALCSENYLSNDTKCTVSIRFNLREGITAESFANNIYKKSSSIRRISKDINKKLDFYHSCGNADCMIINRNLPLRCLLREFLKEGLFSPDMNGFFKDNISSIRTSIIYQIDTDKYLDEFSTCKGLDAWENRDDNRLVLDFTGEDSFKKRNKNCILKMREAIRCYADYAQKHGLSMRQISALNQMINHYENLTHGSHTFDIQVLMIPVWKMLSENIISTVNVCNNNDRCAIETVVNTDGIGVKTDDKIVMQKQIEIMTATLEEFMGIVGSFLQTLSYSDRFFIERMRSSYPAVGSATKLLFAYNRILMELIHAFEIQSQNKDCFEYVCLITCGGCDKTSAYNMSEYVPLYLEKNGTRNLEEKRIIVIQLSERSIYDTSGIIIRCIHEIWHYCGNRFRQERFNSLLRTLCLLRAIQMTDIFLSPRYIWRALFENNIDVNLMTHEEKNECQNELEIIFKRQLKGLQENWSERFNEFIRRYFYEFAKRGEGLASDRFLYYGNNLFRTICAAEYSLYSDSVVYIEQSLNGNSESELEAKAFILRLVRDYEQCLMNIFKELQLPLVRKGYSNLYVKADSLRQMHKNNMADSGQHMDPVLLSGVNTFFKALLEQGDSSPGNTFVKGINAFLTRLSYRISNTLFHNVFDEIYSDYMTCRTLQPSFSEYIYSFLYEDNNLDTAMPDTDVHYMRIGTVIHKYFLHVGDNKNDIEHLLETIETIPVSDYRVDNVEDENYLVDVDAIKEKLKKAWNVYWNYYEMGIVIPFIEYLEICDGNFDTKNSPFKEEVLKEIRHFYQTTRIYAPGKDISEYLNAVIRQWSLLKEDEKDRYVKDNIITGKN